MMEEPTDEDIEDIIPVTESKFEEVMNFREKVFTPEFLEKIDAYIEISKIDIVERFYKKVNALTIDELKLGLPKTDAISVITGLYIGFLDYYKTFQEIIKDQKK